ncbi:MAG: DUF1028 domain-containing protein [Bacteroidota bacterium]
MRLSLLFSTIFILSGLNSFTQHTFSIVAIDSINGQIGSAGATCGDSIIWPGTPGALLISDIIPGIGAIHTQSFYLADNQDAAHDKMMEGLSPQEIIDWLVNNDIQGNPSQRQYGIIDYNNGSPRSAAYTGINCFDYKNHILGSNYAIQGNILLGQEILDNMENNFINTSGSLAEKLMAAMQGANVIGADTRCEDDSTSSLSAFLRVANPNDEFDQLFLDINVAGTAQWVEPIDVLQEKFDQWLLVNSEEELFKTGIQIDLFPNPARSVLRIELELYIPNSTLQVYSMDGKLFRSIKLNSNVELLDVSAFPRGMYQLLLMDTEVKERQRFIVQ